MCLISRWRFPKKAKIDIVCFKVLLDSYYKYVTIFTGDFVDTRDPLEAKGESFKILYPYTKEIGYIHTYSNIEEAKKLKDSRRNFVIFRCIIPKGTKYHISRDGKEMCSKKIIFKCREKND